ncbi:MAG: hypothetical protein IJX14_03210 [Clostridia bacterium]|nr:hypothetical protein [Clostridia bacterium]
MRNWFSSRSRGERVLLWWMTGLVLVYFLTLLGCGLAAEEWILLLPLILLVGTGPFVLSLLLCFRFGLWCLELKNGRIPGQTAADRFSAVLSFAFALTGAGLSLYWFYIHNTGKPVMPDGTELLQFGGVIQTMAIASALLALLPLGMEWVQRKLLSGFALCRRKGWQAGRYILCLLVCAAVLLVPEPDGSYNDGGEDGGGSAQYRAVLYDVVDWNRTHHFDGTPYPPEEQRMRVYFFPYNGYDYEAKWDLKH